MRTTLSALILALLGSLGTAQSIASFTATTYAGTYPGTSAGATVIWDGAVGTYDDNQAQVPIGFPFTYDGTTYTTADVCVNGYITFGSGSAFGFFSNDPMPDVAAPNPVIAGWWDDLVVANNGVTDQVNYNLIGRPGQRRFVVTWSSVSRHLDTAAVYSYVNFQIHLVEGNNQIEFRYGTDGTSGAASDFSATVGVESHAGTFGYDTLGGSPNLNRLDFPPSGRVILYRPGLPAWTYSVSSTPAPYTGLGTYTVLWDGGLAPFDDNTAVLTLGFPFVYDGINFLDVHVCVNGFVTLGPGGPSGDFSNDPVPSFNTPNPALAGWWDDLLVTNFGTLDQIRFAHTGTPGNRHLVIEWRSVSRLGDTAANNNFVNFQIWFNEIDNSVTYWYGNAGTNGFPGDFSASSGIEGHPGDVGVEGIAGSPTLVRADFPNSTRYDFRSAICGDCNGDGGATITDALLAAQHAVAITTLTGLDFVGCNVSGISGGSGVPGATVDILDALAIAQFAVGSLPILSC